MWVSRGHAGWRSVTWPEVPTRSLLSAFPQPGPAASGHFPRAALLQSLGVRGLLAGLWKQPWGALAGHQPPAVSCGAEWRIQSHPTQGGRKRKTWLVEGADSSNPLSREIRVLSRDVKTWQCRGILFSKPTSWLISFNPGWRAGPCTRWGAHGLGSRLGGRPFQADEPLVRSRPPSLLATP